MRSEMIRFRIPLRRFEASACDDWALGSAKSLGCPQFLRQILRRRDAGDKAAEPGLALHRAKINCGAVGEVVENLLSPPSPGMMFAHEFAGRIHGALVVRVASIRRSQASGGGEIVRTPGCWASPENSGGSSVVQ